MPLSYFSPTRSSEIISQLTEQVVKALGFGTEEK
jgi:hypothetical protein